jgi:AcrR family transcriptional regulator
MSDSNHQNLNVPHPDHRIARTLTALVQTFTEQARVQPVEEIAVRDLVRQAGVGRSTFYDHFGSVEDLLLWLVDALIDRSRDDKGDLELERLLTFVAEMREVSSAFLEVDACASRCERALAEALSPGELAAREFAAAGAMGALRRWLTNSDPAPIQEFVAQTCALVDVVLTASSSHSRQGRLRRITAP